MTPPPTTAVVAAVAVRTGEIVAPIDPTVRGSWLLAADDGPAYLVSVDGDGVVSRPASPDARGKADAVIEASSCDLLALLLGRPTRALRVSGDTALAHAFPRAFPGP